MRTEILVGCVKFDAPDIHTWVGFCRKILFLYLGLLMYVSVVIIEGLVQIIDHT